jgi:serine phosphatase RsbU (regulator of sigma subunit)
MTTARTHAPFRLPQTGAFSSPVQRTGVLEWSFASRALPGETTSGDAHCVLPWGEGALAAVVDGLGHGEEATLAARLAMETIARHAGAAVTALVQHCHAALRATRGVAGTFIAFDAREQTLSAIGIGNVECVILRANPRVTPRRDSVLLRGGVIGYQLPALQQSVLPLALDDVVVFATDGVREDFGDLLDAADPLGLNVERVITQKFRGTDDGLVLACKYVGRA